MSTESPHDCCPCFDPAPWTDAELVWENKRFLKDRVRSIFHIPLNFGAVMRRTGRLMDEANARPECPIVLSDENSPWGADVYVETSGDVPGAVIVDLSGTFLSKVFEGPYRDIRVWIKEMNEFVEQRGKQAKQLYFYYTTCPRCAKKYGKNFVVILARI